MDRRDWRSGQAARSGGCRVKNPENMKIKNNKLIPAVFLAAALAIVSSGCGNTTVGVADESVYGDADMELVAIEDESVPLAGLPDLGEGGAPLWVASGEKVAAEKNVAVDYSNASEGYIMVRYDGQQGDLVRARILGPKTGDYTYDLLPDGNYRALPLMDGSGKYKITVFKNSSRMSYKAELTLSVEAAIEDTMAVFLSPSECVNFEPDSKLAAKAAELTADAGTAAEKAEAIYKFLMTGFSYDKEKEMNLEKGYVPKAEEIYSSRRGVHLDFASVMSAMLRSCGVPTKLNFAYNDKACHIWIDTYSDEDGWQKGTIFYDGVSWKFADSAENIRAAAALGEAENYVARYAY